MQDAAEAKEKNEEEIVVEEEEQEQDEVVVEDKESATGDEDLSLASAASCILYSV
tara:strand:+ start:1793 stop:1957 length:165 start_codon:yes stop_codon:yes gene_type:complete